MHARNKIFSEAILPGTECLDEQQALTISLVLFCMFVKISNVAQLKEDSSSELIIVCSYWLTDSSRKRLTERGIDNC